MIHRFLEVLEKTRQGELVPEQKWEFDVVFSETKKVLKEYGLKDTYNKENPINTDLGLADDFWKAAFELALRIGMYCPETERIVKFSEEEIKEAFDCTPTKFEIGFGKDRITIQRRTPEDKMPPITASAAFGIEVSEDLYIPICRSIAQYQKVDMLFGCLLRTIHGHEIRARSPEETLAGMYETELVKEALRQAGRPGMPVFGVEGAATEYGHFGGLCPGGFEPERTIANVLFPTPGKLSYHILHRAAQSKNGRYPIQGSCATDIYGYFGPPEGGVLGSIALQMLVNTAVQPHVIGGTIIDVRYSGNAGGEALWAKSVAAQARSRNTPIINVGFTAQTNGPDTYMLLYESALTALTYGVSGDSIIVGTRSAASRYPNHCSSLENKFIAEITKASANLNLSDVNHLVKNLLDTIPDYENKLRHPSKGKSFLECMDMETLQPKESWKKKYEEVWKKLEDLGVPRF